MVILVTLGMLFLFNRIFSHTPWNNSNIGNTGNFAYFIDFFHIHPGISVILVTLGILIHSINPFKQTPWNNGNIGNIGNSDLFSIDFFILTLEVNLDKICPSKGNTSLPSLKCPKVLAGHASGCWPSVLGAGVPCISQCFLLQISAMLSRIL